MAFSMYKQSLKNKILYLHLQNLNFAIMGNYIRFDWAMKRLLRYKANFQAL